MTEPEVTIVIPAYRDTFPLERCLESIYANTPPYIYKLIIGVDEPSEELKKWLTRKTLACMVNGATVILNPHTSSFAKNVNCCLKIVDTRYVAIVCQDICVHTYWINYLYSVLKNNPNLGWVTARGEQYDGQFRPFNVSCSLLDMEAINKVGYIDEQFNGAFEDDDWYMRFIQSGYRPHGVKNVVSSHLHTGGYSLLGENTKNSLFLQNKQLFYGKWGMLSANLSSVPCITVTNDRYDWLRCNVEGKVLDVGSATGITFGDYATNLDVMSFGAPNFVKGNAEELPFPDNLFSVVCYGDILEHVNDPVKVLKEGIRVGKKIIATVPDDHNIRGIRIGINDTDNPESTPEYRGAVKQWQFDSHICSEPSPNTFHMRHYTEEMLIEHLNKAEMDYTYEYKQLHDWVGWLVIAKRKERKVDNEV